MCIRDSGVAAENTTRLARLVLESLNGEDQSSQPLLAWLSALAVEHALVLPAVPSASQARRVFERSLIGALADTQDATSVGYNLAALRRSASAVRERLSQEQWNVIVRAEQEFNRGCAICTEDGDYSPVEALRVLETLSGHTAAMTGAQTDRMMRDDGWRLLSSGRHIERLGFLSSALGRALDTGAVFDEGGFEALVALFDSTITFHSHYQQRRDIPALLDLLVLDRENPRSLGWVATTLRGRLSRLTGTAPGEVAGIALTVPDPQGWSLEALCERDGSGRYPRLQALLEDCSSASWQLSDNLSARYFTHSGEARYVGA